jgi:hypothetical protein
MTDADLHKGLIKKWQETGHVLAAIRWTELAAMRAEESQLAALDMLNLASALPDDSERAHYSGLVEMQRLFSKLREPVRA